AAARAARAAVPRDRQPHRRQRPAAGRRARRRYNRASTRGTPHRIPGRRRAGFRLRLKAPPACRMTVRELRVSLGERSYPILIGPGLLGRSDALSKLAQGRQVAVVTNDTVAALYEARLAASLAGATTRLSIRLPD